MYCLCGFLLITTNSWGQLSNNMSMQSLFCAVLLEKASLSNEGGYGYK